MTPGRKVKKSKKASNVSQKRASLNHSDMKGEDKVASEPMGKIVDDWAMDDAMVPVRRTRPTSKVIDNMKQEYKRLQDMVMKQCNKVRKLLDSSGSMKSVIKAATDMRELFAILYDVWGDLESNLTRLESGVYLLNFQDTEAHVAEIGKHEEAYIDDLLVDEKLHRRASDKNRISIDHSSYNEDTALMMEQMKLEHEQQIKDLVAQNQRQMDKLIHDRSQRSKENEMLHPNSVKMEDGYLSDRAASVDSDTQVGNSGINAVLKELAVSNAMLARTCGLPEVKVGVFDGDVLQYLAWETSFDALIQSKTCNVHELLNYLESHLSGPPKEMIQGLLLLQSKDAYERARRRLKDRYGNDNVICKAFLNRLAAWPKIGVKDAVGLRKFADFLDQVSAAQLKISGLGVLNFATESNKIIGKLPPSLRGKWRDKVYKWRCQNGEASYPSLVEVARFVDECAEKMNIPELDDLDKPYDSYKNTNQSETFKGGNKYGQRVTSFSTKAEPNRTDKNKCAYCGEGSHLINECEGFNGIVSHTEKKQFLSQRKLCYGCGSSSDHGVKFCKQRVSCKVCGKKHLTALHRGKENVDSKCTKVCSIKGQIGGKQNSMIVPVYVSTKDNPSERVKCYCILDGQSNGSFITDDLKERLGINGVKTKLQMSTMYKSGALVDSERVTGVIVSSIDLSACVFIPQMYSRIEVPADASQIPKPEVARQWDHLAGIAEEIMPFDQTLKVSILIGCNVPGALRPRKILVGGESEPYGQLSLFGWGIVGNVCKDLQAVEYGSIVSHRAVIGDISDVSRNETMSENVISRKDVTFSFMSKAKELVSAQQVNHMMELDFVEHHGTTNAMSIEDKRFLKILSENVVKRSDGHYEFPLPMKYDNAKVLNNKPLALKRAAQVKRRLEKNKNLHDEYTNQMKTVITKFAEVVPMDRLNINDGKVNYIPHSPVFHNKKGTLRIVNDMSATYGGICINDMMLAGPKLMENMTGILLRFRKHEIAIMGDIEKMFFQFYVQEKDRDMLRFLWWDNGDLSKDLTEYRMKVFPFGSVSSPGVAMYGMKLAADDGEKEFGSPAAEFVRSNFYVDDGLTSVDSVEEAVNLVQNSVGICAKAGLRLHKFVSNNREVLEAIPESERAKGLQGIDFGSGNLSLERSLGLLWNPELDVFQFRKEWRDKPATRRGVLSVVSAIFDPMGYLAPVLLIGKALLQELCKLKLDWDTPLPEKYRSKWNKWLLDLADLEKVQIKRCVKPVGFGEVKAAELHSFSDSSENGYGQCSFLRLINDKDEVHCTLIMAKSRVAPLKQVSIPRMELTAAVLSARMGKFLREELNYKQLKEYYWVDSNVVLGYINNVAKRFHVFVANRVQQIHDLTDVSCWMHVSGSENPSDIASRGMSLRKLIDTPSWWKGPEFLRKKGEFQPVVKLFDPDKKTSEILNMEMKKITAFSTNAVAIKSWNSDLKMFSSWFRAKRAVANCIKIKHKLKKLPESDCITVATLSEAKKVIIGNLQWEYFPEEMTSLKSSSTKGKFQVSKTSSLYRLDPFIDKDGLMRVGGRLRNSWVAREIKHPILLPRKSHVTSMIINHFHVKVNHMGRGITHNEIRQNGYWIIGGVSAVSRYIHNCVLCRRFRKPLCVQKMSDLPECRLAEEGPFTFCSCDFFGPYYIRERRSTTKRYAVLFSCLSSRAVHLEVANSMDTDSFINALRRFLARRGPIRSLTSDCGSNIIGGKNELRKAVGEMDQSKVRKFLLSQDCDLVEFKFHVPKASHMNGNVERQILTVKRALDPVLREIGSHLDDESLRTFFVEVENVVNSKPLTVTNLADSNAPEPLTPNHLLTMKPKVLMPPPGKFCQTDVYARHRWRRTQYAVNQFWDRWRKEFLQTLQARKKWCKPGRNIQPGDVVLIHEEDLPRNKWKLGVVESTMPSSDNLVRKVKVRVGDSTFDSADKKVRSLRFLERPIHKLVLLVPAKDRMNSTDEEPHVDC